MTKISVRLDVSKLLWESSKMKYGYFNIGKHEFFETILKMFSSEDLGFMESFLGELVESGRLSENESLFRLNLLRQRHDRDNIYNEGIHDEM